MALPPDGSKTGDGERAEEAARVRVIVAGRTGVEGALRRDRRVELVRAADGLEAIGELSDPIDAASPARAVVIVGAGAAPDEARAHGELVASLRQVDPGVRVLRAGVNGVGAEAYDGATDESRALEDVLAANGEATATKRTRTPAPERGATARAAADEFGDGRLARALAQGEEVLPAALALLSERLGVPATFESDCTSEGDAPVTWREHTFGYLRAPGINAALLARASSWLASWLVLADQRAQLQRAAFTDPLTGAWNRRYLEQFLKRAFERARTQRRPVTVLVFDIDDFKRFNDRHGHDAGDQILIETVRLLRSVIRPTDRVCRTGGDEFVVVFDEPEGPRSPGSQPPTTVEQIARRFQKQICEHRFPKLAEDAPGTLTISAGLAAFPWDGATPDELVRAADGFALESKRQGKNALTVGPGAARVCEAGESDPDDYR